MATVKDFLDKAIRYEKEGHQKEAEKFFKLAEKFEECKKKINERMSNRR